MLDKTEQGLFVADLEAWIALADRHAVANLALSDDSPAVEPAIRPTNHDAMPDRPMINTLNVEEIFRRADMALYRAKVEGRDTSRFFEIKLDEALADRLRLEFDLGNAIPRRELELHYQPVLDTRRQAFSGFEAVLRWRHPERGLIPPCRFIPIAEESGLILPIGEWVFRKACKAAMSWSDPDLRVSVNVSAMQLQRSDLLGSLRAALAASGLDPRRLEIEVTESALMGDDDAVAETLQRIRAEGVGVALDDFAMGHASLGYLHRFVFDRIKIDRSFVKEIRSPRTAAMIRATIELADRLGMSVTADGVETADQLDRLMVERCNEIQGHFIGRPVSGADARTLASAPPTSGQRRHSING